MHMMRHVQQLKCEKDGKAYVEGVPRSERSFDQLTEREDLVVSRDGLVLSSRTDQSRADSRGGGCVLARLYFRFCVSLLAHSSSLSSHFFSHFDVATMRPLAPLGTINLHS